MPRAFSLTTLLFTLIHVSASAGHAAHSVEEAKALLNAGRYREALPILRKSAASGNPEGELYLGLMYQSGWSVAQDYTQARQWYEKSAAVRMPPLAFIHVSTACANGPL